MYHVTSRGDRREAIYLDDTDRRTQLSVIAQAMDRFDAQVLAYCQMGNHFHLVLHTRRANLSRVMRHVNGVYTQAFNRRHGLVGHLLQGRFKAILVDCNEHLLTLCRYVERNPVAAAMADSPRQWPWSSCQAHLGQVPTPEWLDSDGLHGFVLGRQVTDTRDRCLAADRYAALVGQAQPEDDVFWRDALRGQVFLGDEDFVQRMQALAEPERKASRAIPKKQRHPPLTWQQCLLRCGGDRNRALATAYRQAGTTMTTLAGHTGLSVSHVSRLIALAEKGDE